MHKEQKFFICNHCENVIQMIRPSGVKVVCCGEEMAELIANTSDGATEKHVPEVSIEEGLVTVAIGSVPHPMVEEHHIEWIYLKTNRGGQMKGLKVGKDAKATFALSEGEKVKEVYEYCNLHGLWKKDI